MTIELATPEAEAAPVKVTPEMLEAQIAGQYFFNLGADALPPDVPEWQRQSLGLLTLCMLVLRNGWVVVGKSSCVSPEVFDPEEGKRLAREDAVEQMWPLEGYVLKTFLHMQNFGAEVEVEPEPEPAPQPVDANGKEA